MNIVKNIMHPHRLLITSDKLQAKTLALLMIISQGAYYSIIKLVESYIMGAGLDQDMEALLKVAFEMVLASILLIPAFILFFTGVVYWIGSLIAAKKGYFRYYKLCCWSFMIYLLYVLLIGFIVIITSFMFKINQDVMGFFGFSVNMVLISMMIKSFAIAKDITWIKSGIIHLIVVAAAIACSTATRFIFGI